MSPDEQAIRNLVSTWMTASKSGDTQTILSLMTDDVVFLTPGQPPFGKERFTSSANATQGVKVDGTAEVIEVQVFSDWAWMRNRLRITITPPGGQPMVKSGFTLTVLRKANGKWAIARDANLLADEVKR